MSSRRRPGASCLGVAGPRRYQGACTGSCAFSWWSTSALISDLDSEALVPCSHELLIQEKN